MTFMGSFFAFKKMQKNSKKRLDLWLDMLYNILLLVIIGYYALIMGFCSQKRIKSAQKTLLLPYKIA